LQTRPKVLTVNTLFRNWCSNNKDNEQPERVHGHEPHSLGSGSHRCPKTDHSDIGLSQIYSVCPCKCRYITTNQPRSFSSTPFPTYYSRTTFVRARNVNKQKKHHYLRTVNSRHPQHLSSNKVSVYYNHYNLNQQIHSILLKLQ
jgi:hypothetical protein